MTFILGLIFGALMLSATYPLATQHPGTTPLNYFLVVIAPLYCLVRFYHDKYRIKRTIREYQIDEEETKSIYRNNSVQLIGDPLELAHLHNALENMSDKYSCSPVMNGVFHAVFFLLCVAVLPTHVVFSIPPTWFFRALWITVIAAIIWRWLFQPTFQISPGKLIIASKGTFFRHGRIRNDVNLQDATIQCNFANAMLVITNPGSESVQIHLDKLLMRHAFVAALIKAMEG